MLSVKQSFILITILFLTIYLGTRVYLKYEGGKYEESDIMRNAMGNILIIFGFLKLVNIGGFVEVFSKYDIIANNLELYGYFIHF